mgnify:CR=1 FL=1
MEEAFADGVPRIQEPLIEQQLEKSIVNQVVQHASEDPLSLHATGG